MHEEAEQQHVLEPALGAVERGLALHEPARERGGGEHRERALAGVPDAPCRAQRNERGQPPQREPGGEPHRALADGLPDRQVVRVVLHPRPPGGGRRGDVARRGHVVVVRAPAEQRTLGERLRAGLPDAQPVARGEADPLGAGRAFEQHVAAAERRAGALLLPRPVREWGASGAFAYDPRPSSDRGLSASLTQTWGAASSGGMDALLNRETLAGLAANDDDAPFEAASRLEGEVGYGLAAFGGGFTGTPNLGFGISSSGAREYRLGWRLIPADGGGFEVNIDAARREAANDDAPEHRVMLRSAVRW